MKSSKFFFTILCCLCFTFINAQTTYKGVTIDRDKSDNTRITIRNANDAAVKVKLQYKVGSRETSWIDYGGYIRVEKYSTETVRVGSKIYGLNLIYVDILNQEKVGEFFQELFGGEQKTNSNTSSNSSSTNNSSSSSNSNSNENGLRCFKCGGSGTIDGHTCPECNGTGKQTKPVPFPEPEKRY